MASLKIDEDVFDKLAEVLKKHNLNEIEYKNGDVKIRLSAGVDNARGGKVDVVVPEPATIAISQAEIQTPEKSVASASVSANPEDFSTHPGAVKSPMVGTCYLAPEPGAGNFVALGDSVQEGQPLLIIEAMKVMNLIKAPKAGKVIHIAVSNSDPIEFGQLLVVIE